MARRAAPSKGLLDFNKAIDAIGEKVEGVLIDEFRRAVWAVFQELVLTTPQFRGTAAANWNLGLNAPDFSVDYDLGERVTPAKAKDGHMYNQSFYARKVGDMKWAEEAFARNKYKLRQITRDTKVYITNAVRGDPDVAHGRTSQYYLADLQDPSYWATRLRIENQPYETVSQVILMESWRLRLNENIMDKAFFQ
jgi:hypothetical protein